MDDLEDKKELGWAMKLLLLVLFLIGVFVAYSLIRYLSVDRADDFTPTKVLREIREKEKND